METYLCKHHDLKKGGTCPHFLVKKYGIRLECKDCRYSKLESSQKIVIEGIIEL